VPYFSRLKIAGHNRDRPATRMADYDDIADLIGLVCDAALEWQAWPAALNCLADFVGAAQVSLVTYDMSTHVVAGVAPRQDPDYMRSYVEYWAARNPLWPRSAFAPIGALITPEMFIRREDYARTDFVNEWASPQGMEAALGINVNLEGPASTVLAVYRPYSRGDFDDRERALFGALAPHLRRAAQLRLRLSGIERKEAGFVEALHRLHQGVLLADAGARIVFANRAAEEILAARDGLRCDGGVLRAEKPAETARLHRLIALCSGPEAALGAAGGPTLISRTPGRHPLSLLVIPPRMGTAPLFVAGAAIVFVTDPEREHPVREESLRWQFGLTPAEAAVAAAALRGDGLTARRQSWASRSRPHAPICARSSTRPTRAARPSSSA